MASQRGGLSEKAKPLNNNSNRNNGNNNNRRRGRNNNRGGGGGGGGIQGNRIDSRARGNAPQMLEKYRKLAHDASLNDDRVLTEYYLQFADHYFRVMADMKAQKDEQQQQRGPRPERGPDEDGDYTSEDDFDPRTRQYQPQGQAQQRPYRGENEEFSEGMEGEADEGSNPFSPDRRPQRADRNDRNDRPERQERPERSEPREPRENREPRARKPARRRAEAEDENQDSVAGLDASILPPAIARADAQGEDDGADAPPARKPLRVRTRKPRTDESDEALEAVG